MSAQIEGVRKDCCALLWNLLTTVSIVIAAALVAAPTHANSPQTLVAVVDASKKTTALGLDQASTLRSSQAVIGQKVSDFILLDREGRPVRLSSYRGVLA